MKRKTLIFTLALAMVAPWAAFGQETYTVYEDGTATNSNIPLGYATTSYNVKSQFIIPESDLPESMVGKST